MKTIGPSFESEIAAAGLRGLPFSWGADGQMNLSQLTPEQRSAVLAVYNAHDPSRPGLSVDQADLDNMERSIKVVAELMRRYCNELRAGTYTNKTPAQLKADARAIWTSLP